MTAFLKVLECRFFNISSTDNTGTANASTNQLSCIAVHTMPFLSVEDGMVLNKPQLPNVLALIRC